MQPLGLLWVGGVGTFAVVSGVVLALLGFAALEAAYIARLGDLTRLLARKRAGDLSLAVGTTGTSLLTRVVRIPASSRDKHLYVVGASGSGKSSLIYNLILQDIAAGMGLILIDPHGDLVKDLLPMLGNHARRTLVLDLEDTGHMLSYNPFVKKPGVMVAEQVAKLMLAFKRVWADSWGPRMEDVLRQSLTLLIEQGYTLCEFERLLTDDDFRQMLVEQSSEPQARDYFLNRFERWSSKERTLNTESSLNKVSALLADPRIAARLAQTVNCITLADVIAKNQILLVNLAKGRLAANADLFGAFLMADIETSFLSRPKKERTPFAVYIDEFQNIATDSFASVLAEARKFGLCLTLVHQSLMQLEPELIALILGNAQSQVYFRVARQDSERLAKEANNIVSQLEAQVAREEQRAKGEKPKRELSLSEMWELAYHKLTDLKPRQAYITVRGLINEPELVTMMENPKGGDTKLNYGRKYRKLAQLEDTAKLRREEIGAALGERAEATRQAISKKKGRIEPVSTMDFLSRE